MTLKIRHKRSAVAGKAPLPADLEYGEIAVNYEKTDPAFYIKDSDNVVRKIGSGGAAGVVSHFQEFLTNGTWTKPPGVQVVYVEIIGGGDGGSAGARQPTSGSTRSSGPGGKAGKTNRKFFHAPDLPATVSVTIGAGGKGHPGITTDSTTFAIGTPGGLSSFGTFETALTAGDISPGGGGKGAVGSGGGALPVNSTAPVAGTPGGVSAYFGSGTTVAAGGTSGGAGADAIPGRGGGGGGGSYGGPTGPYGAGGKGAIPGGGGGAGSPSDNGHVSGAGADGGHGIAYVWSW